MLFFGHRDNRTTIGFGRHYRDHLAGSAVLIEHEHASHCSIWMHYEKIPELIFGTEVKEGRVVGLK